MSKNSLFIRVLLLVCKSALQALCFKKWAICWALILTSGVSLANKNELVDNIIKESKNNPTPSEELNNFKPSKITIEHIYALEKIMFFSLDPAQKADAGLLRKFKPQGDMQDLQRKIQEGKIRSIEDYNQHRRSNPISTSFSQRMGGAIKGFPLETVIFYAAIGASMWTKDLAPRFATLNPGVQNGREDPQWVDTWVHEFTSPIGLFSFLCFVLTSNVTQYAYTQAINSRWAKTSAQFIGAGSRMVGIRGIKGQLSWTRRSRAGLTITKTGKLQYRFPRMMIGTLGALGGQLGMALGMTASNIVHEIHNFTVFNPNFKECWDEELIAINSENSALACDMAFEEGVRNVWSWAPMIGSLLTASLISHQLVSFSRLGLRKLGQKAKNKKWIQVAVNFVPQVRGLKWAFHNPLTRWLRKHNVFFRLLHLTAFMETDQRLTTPLFDTWWTEPMKAQETVSGVGHYTNTIWGAVDKGWGVKGGMENFIKYHDVDYSTPYRTCEDEDEKECHYHESILSMHKTASYFDQWRGYKMQMASFAHQNWMSYVLKGLGAFNLSRDFYQELFVSKEYLSSPLHQIYYFGEYPEPQALLAIQEIKKQIDNHLAGRGGNTDHQYPLKQSVISLSPSRFLKSPEQIQAIRTDNTDEISLLILKNLFSVADLNISLDSYESQKYEWDQKLKQVYGSEWEQALTEETKRMNEQKRSEKQWVLKNLGSQKIALENARWDQDQQKWIVEWNDQIHPFSELELQEANNELENRINDLWNEHSDLRADLSVEVYRNLKNRALSAGLEYLRTIVQQKVRIQKANFLPTNALLTKGPEYSNLAKKLLALKDKETNGTSETSLTSEEKAEMVLLSMLLSKSAVDRIDYIVALQGEQQQTGQDIEENWDAKDSALMAQKRSELNRIHNKISVQMDRLNQINLVPTGEGVIPPEAAQAFHRLGGENIFAKLYAVSAQIKPLAEGRMLITQTNQMESSKKETYSIENYQPERVNLLKTPSALDFLLVSAVCGPDLTKKANLAVSDGAFRMAQGMITHSEELNDRLKNPEDILTDEDKSLMEKAQDLLGEDVPVFQKFVAGQAFHFYPPRMTNMKEEDRQAICGHFPVVGNIYDSSFKVGGKEYFSLLEVVKDHIGTEKISSAEEFDKWWEANMIPYQDIFEKTADFEHQYVVQGRFIKSFFQEETNNSAVMKSPLADSLKNTSGSISKEGTNSAQETSWDFLWDSFSYFSKKWFTDEGIQIEGSKDGIPFWMVENRGILTPEWTKSPLKHYKVHQPKGFFRNTYFEAHYWADIILHFAKKRKAHWVQQGWDTDLDDILINIPELELGLKDLIEQFKVPANCLGSEADLKKGDKIKACINWSKKYVSLNGENPISWDKVMSPPSQEEPRSCDDEWSEPQESPLKSFWQNLCQVSDSLYIVFDEISKQAQLKTDPKDPLKKYVENNINSKAFWTKPTDKPAPNKPKLIIAPLPDQIINYALWRLYQLRSGAHYQALMVVQHISEQTDLNEQKLTLDKPTN